MKILCCGDVHLGASPDLGRVPFGEGSRLEDQALVLRRIAKLAISERVDGVIFAGDAFHKRRPSPSELMVWRGFVEVLGDEGIGMIACAGNHDVESEDRPTGLEVVGGNGYYDPMRRPGVSYGFPGLAVAVLPWTSPARLVASQNGGGRDEINETVATLLIDAARELREEIREFDHAGERVAILCAHWSVSGSSLPNGLPVDQLREPILPLPDLEELGFDYMVFGHIHQPQLWSTVEGAWSAFYVGSPAIVDFGETKSEHGAWIINTEQRAAPSFSLIEDRRFLTVDCDLTTERHAELGLDETDAIAAAIATQFPVEEAVLRIRYRATSEQARRVDVAALRKLCAEAGVSKLYAIQAQIEREDRARVEGVDETLAPLEALYEWTKAQQLPHEQAEAVGALTARYLEEAVA